MKHFYLTLVLIISLVSSVTQAESLYALVVYGYQNRINSSRASHTFATFIEVPTEGAPLKVHTISWLPANGQLRPLALLPERGFNFSLQDTFRFASQSGSTIRRWGPIRISPELYQSGVARSHYLDSGYTSYKVLDHAHRRQPANYQRGGAVNCIHAVSDTGGYIETGLLHGWAASELVFRHLSRFAVPRGDNLEWVAQSMGIQLIPRQDMNFR